MKITVESTSKIVELTHNANMIPARVWEGTTESGIPVVVFVTRVMVSREEDCAQFDQELLEQRVPSPDVAALPLRLIL